LDHSEAFGAKNIRWISQEGLTPGWDLQYENHDGEVIAVEVKGTTGPVFGSVDVDVIIGRRTPPWPWRIATGSISLRTAAEPSLESKGSRTPRVF
jgi:hypothetical protein